MSFEEMPDVKVMNDGAKCDAHITFGDKKTRKSFTNFGSSQRVTATDELADGHS